MPSPLSRRSFFAAGGSGLTLLLAACSTGPADGGASAGSGSASSASSASSAPAEGGAFPVTVEHVYGTTEITAVSYTHLTLPTNREV